MQLTGISMQMSPTNLEFGFPSLVGSPLTLSGLATIFDLLT